MTPLPPGSTIGILGGGQLGRMLAAAAARLGFDVAVLDPEPDCPASRVCARHLLADYDDPAALEALAGVCSVVTVEFENVPASALEILLARGARVAPGPRALSTAQDRVEEKTFLNAAGAPTVDFRPASTEQEAADAAAALGGRVLIKTRRDGYDGKGQAWAASAQDAAGVFRSLGSRPVIVEAPAAFRRELSIIAARSWDGAMAAFPLAENRHQDGILRRSSAPARVEPARAREAEDISRKVLAALDYVGVIGIELFELQDGGLLVNEIAPRVHNSGHWTQDGTTVDQFEQHIRAIAGWPLGAIDARARVEMENLLGEDVLQWPAIVAEPNARLHLYGKREARAGRKMGHVNRVFPLKV
ncbi:MAG: 5-(carboxyamino)imidazole ribonucleotide synthase [Phenylobacterium sp.]|uniref:5-(carboxyamino)imidazole ribonucleotide synthase n=1 Tax=Phenylobacterium sp. TaxID=1871053 RepID=UPI0025D4389F|nr:5-(carboxyamino)imidazole ribonucleotide synthase [Phenylobacterium sp.]MCA6224374.1 5-(carboxyamino)imidazole ribonucleotide synthase [Phenylobacterium sp.]MCA6227451.1 5-(carboxyamino)imidazole ribonucleotide synthase [Phenylobacterium sp.]MCA6230859.1 5-(carboxyamino)imidazole ribonucleotide synthase [Phenylobacterium sp.]MCA6235871.1 5-(carboxyamino)imidazole ribonucleotide synthase [Phenylobacterium sp.]MCA6248784.1 5-(carboxyamino)imidazole ribonucleotide synthase [Phenylobacterium sp